MPTTGSLPARGQAIACGLDHLGRRTIDELPLTVDQPRLDPVAADD